MKKETKILKANALFYEFIEHIVHESSFLKLKKM